MHTFCLLFNENLFWVSQLWTCPGDNMLGVRKCHQPLGRLFRHKYVMYLNGGPSHLILIWKLTEKNYITIKILLFFVNNSSQACMFPKFLGVTTATSSVKPVYLSLRVLIIRQVGLVLIIIQWQREVLCIEEPIYQKITIFKINVSCFAEAFMCHKQISTTFLLNYMRYVWN